MSNPALSSIAIFLVFTLVLLTLGAGAGVATADRGDNEGKQCPPQTGGENPTQAYEEVPPTAVESSEYGRTTSLLVSGCIDAESVEPFGEVG